MPQPPLDYETPNTEPSRSIWSDSSAMIYAIGAGTLVLFCLLINILSLWIAIRHDPRNPAEYVAVSLFSGATILTTPLIILIHSAVKPSLPQRYQRALRLMILIHLLTIPFALIFIARTYWH